MPKPRGKLVALEVLVVLCAGCGIDAVDESGRDRVGTSASVVATKSTSDGLDDSKLLEHRFRGIEQSKTFSSTFAPKKNLVPNSQSSGEASIEDVLAKIKKEDFKSAEADLRSLAWKSPNDPALSYLLALCLYRQDKYVTAKVHIDTAVKNADPVNREYEYLGGLIYFALREYETAIDRFTAAEQLEVSNETLYRLRAASFLNRRRYDAAVADATKALAEDSDNPESYYIRSCAQAMLDQKAAAQADFDSAKILGLDAKRTEDLEKLLAR